MYSFTQNTYTQVFHGSEDDSDSPSPPPNSSCLDRQLREESRSSADPHPHALNAQVPRARGPSGMEGSGHSHSRVPAETGATPGENSVNPDDTAWAESPSSGVVNIPPDMLSTTPAAQEAALLPSSAPVSHPHHPHRVSSTRDPQPGRNRDDTNRPQPSTPPSSVKAKSAGSQRLAEAAGEGRVISLDTPTHPDRKESGEGVGEAIKIPCAWCLQVAMGS